MALQIAHRIGIAPHHALGMTLHHIRVLVDADAEEKREDRRRGLERAWYGAVLDRQKKLASLDEVLGWAGPRPAAVARAQVRRQADERRAMERRMLDRWARSAGRPVRGQSS
jgi:hypothetical protein